MRWQLYFQGLLQKKFASCWAGSSLGSGELRFAAAADFLQSPFGNPPASWTDTRTCIQRQSSAQENSQQQKHRKRERKAAFPSSGLHLPWRGEARCLAAVPLSQAAAV